MRRLALLTVLALTGCDQFFPYDKEPVQVCGPVTHYYDEATGVYVGSSQVCWTEWVRATPEPCTTDSECAAAHPDTHGDYTP